MGCSVGNLSMLLAECFIGFLRMKGYDLDFGFH